MDKRFVIDLENVKKEENGILHEHNGKANRGSEVVMAAFCILNTGI